MQAARNEMVRVQLENRGIRSRSVLQAFRRVPRHEFVPPSERDAAYSDYPLPIGAGQTISQPYVVAYTLEQARIQASDRVLEIGSGSGYQTALLAELAAEVHSVEMVEELAAGARKILHKLGYRNVKLRVGDGTQGWAECAPYDAIVGSAAPPEIPRPLLEQLAQNGRLVLPVGTVNQQLVLVRRTADGVFERTALLAVRFVPMLTDA